MSDRKGIVLAGGSGTRLYPLTISVSKQLMPVYDKPMVYYPISILMLSGIREILIISTPHDLPQFRSLLGDGARFGVQFTYAEQPNPEGLAQALIIAEDFLDGSSSALILGDNVFHGHDLEQILSDADSKTQGATIFGYHVADPSIYGVVEFDDEGNAVSLEEKPSQPKSNYAVPGLYFYDGNAPLMAKAIEPSARGELEITDLNLAYLNQGELSVQVLGRGTAWLDTGSHDNLASATDFVKVIERRQGLKIACLEEIGYYKGWLEEAAIEAAADRHGSSPYGAYLRAMLKR
ncbi:MAG: glucose-1-phosphate thymidylyltransferase [Opitutae bacterium]|jgi:glucose-1-phosphate thymidylyltransferase|nr:glucose-1-phosphate thymidylyltransferase [Opitutae bacterium]|tara:strand:+ start:2116 stop:2991 length:876 start_codon:yes stop_codon:yes gene_type:complete